MKVLYKLVLGIYIIVVEGSSTSYAHITNL